MTQVFTQFKTVTPRKLDITPSTLNNLEMLVSSYPHRKIGELDLEVLGFIPDDEGKFVNKASDYYVLRIRHDKKEINSKHVTRLAKESLRKKKDNGENVDPDNRKQLKEEKERVTSELCKTAQYTDSYYTIIIIPEKNIILFNVNGKKLELVTDLLVETLREKVVLDLEFDFSLSGVMLDTILKNEQTENLKFNGYFKFRDGNATYTIKEHPTIDSEVIVHASNHELTQVGLTLLNEKFDFTLKLDDGLSLSSFKFLTLDATDTDSTESVEYMIIINDLLDVIKYLQFDLNSSNF